jgi:hypothetical protein
MVSGLGALAFQLSFGVCVIVSTSPLLLTHMTMVMTQHPVEPLVVPTAKEKHTFVLLPARDDATQDKINWRKLYNFHNLKSVWLYVCMSVIYGFLYACL